MAASLQFTVASSTNTAAPFPIYLPPKSLLAGRRFISFPSKTKPLLKLTCGNSNKHRFFTVKAIEESKESVEDTVTANESEPESGVSDESELSAIGEEIKKAMKERAENNKDNGTIAGVAEEIREIEWPPFGKVLGTTGIVLGVIAGSSVVLLTVNAVLAELSDRVFAGKGVQDFFS